MLADDGSTDGTRELLAQLEASCPDVSIVNLPKHAGKAETVRQGMLFALQSPDLAAVKWFGYWDVDMSTPLEEVERMLAYADRLYPSAEVILGSRVHRIGSDIRRSTMRHILGRVFATLVGVLFPDLGVYDSQCGAKLFKRKAAEQAFAQPFVTDWVFDVELILRLRDKQAVEDPLTLWHEKGKGHVRPLRIGPRVLLDLYRLKKAYGKKDL